MMKGPENLAIGHWRECDLLADVSSFGVRDQLFLEMPRVHVCMLVCVRVCVCALERAHHGDFGTWLLVWGITVSG